MVFAHLEVSLATLVILPSTEPGLLGRYFYNLKLMAEKRLDIGLRSVENPFLGVFDKLIVFPTVDPKDVALEACLIHNTNIATGSFVRKRRDCKR
jgi:hypothetical protein